LKNAISINILVATAGHAKSILCLSLGRVDILIAKAKLAKLILSMELAGRGGWDSNRYRSRCNRKRGWGRCQSKRSRYLSKRKRDWGRSDRKRSRDLSNRSWSKVQRCRDLGKRQSFRLRSWHKRKLVWLEDLVNWEEIACIRDKSRNRCNRSGSHWYWLHKMVKDRSRGIMYNRNRKGQRKCFRKTISCFNWLSFTLSVSSLGCFTLLPCIFSNNSNCSLCFGMRSKMLGTGLRNFWSFHNRYWSNKRSSNWKLRGNRKSYSGGSWSNRNICTSNTEAIDRVSNIVHSLKNAISINILVATAGHAKSILCLSLGRVNVLITKAKLAKLILSMELT